MSEESRSFREEIDKWSKTSAVDLFALIGLGGLMTAIADKVINHGKTLIRPDDGLSEWERSFRKGMGVAFVGHTTSVVCRKIDLVTSGTLDQKSRETIFT